MSVPALRTELCKKSAVCWPLTTQLSARVGLTMCQKLQEQEHQLSFQSSPCPLSPSPAPSLVLFRKNKFKKERLLLKQTRSDIKGKTTAGLAQALLGGELKYIYRYRNPWHYQPCQLLLRPPTFCQGQVVKKMTAKTALGNAGLHPLGFFCRQGA